MRLNAIFLGLLCVILASCNSTPVKEEPLISLSPAEIKTVQNFDELLAMRARLSAALAGKSVTDYASDYAALAQIEAQLIDVKKAEAGSFLASKRLKQGVVSLVALNKFKEDLAASMPLPAEKWLGIRSLIDAELTKTQKLVDDLSTKLEGEKEAKAKLDLYEELYSLSGDINWKSQQQALVDNLLADVRAAASGESFDEQTQAKVKLIKSLRGDDANLLDELVSVDAKIYAKRFFDSLSEGQADEAYEILAQMSKAQDFPAIKGKLAPTSQKMADYFTALADESVKEPANLKQSYRWYHQAREVRDILGVKAIDASAFSALTDQLYARYEHLLKSDELEAALAHIYGVNMFQPARPGIRKTLTQQETAVRNLSVQRLSTTDFQSAYKDQDYGDVISSFITQYLFEHLPYDVRIVEREQYEAILRERQLSGNTESLSSVNLLVSGSVLESKVESSEAKNKKMMRVEVGNETIPNPSYISWLELGAKDRKGVEKPAEVIVVPKHENISVGVTRHRKVGIFSVSYRLVEASSGRVILPDSIRTSSEHEDESSEGVEMGDFIVPFKQADLPSDVQILDNLAKQVAKEIGEKLVGKLQNQEEKYLSAADKAKQQNDCVGETMSLGKALMIMKLKSLDTASVTQRFQNIGVACFN